MPRIHRWFPCSEDANGDPETWELTDLFGDRAIRTYIEVWAIINRTNNRWMLTQAGLESLARKVRQYPATVSRELDWMLAKHWLVIMRENGTPGEGTPTMLADSSDPAVHEGLKNISSAAQELQKNHSSAVKELLKNRGRIVLAAPKYAKYHHSRETKGDDRGPPQYKTEEKRKLKIKEKVFFAKNAKPVRPETTAPPEPEKIVANFRSYTPRHPEQPAGEEQTIRQGLRELMGQLRRKNRDENPTSAAPVLQPNEGGKP
jgi:hypothetical protein